jgi:hypothetical protein
MNMTHPLPSTGKRQRALARTALAMALTTLALAGCGGGGDTDDDSGPTGLVPTAPALGATLFNDATVLRPLVAGASWQYAGIAPDGDSYTNVITQTSASPGVTESGTNTFDSGPSHVHVTAVNSNIIQPDPIDANGDGINDFANLIELRSPVRVNDQIVAIDQRLSNMVPDIDGDGHAEALDLATYSRVIGTEDVDLNGPPTQQAVRIDRITAARVVLSKDGQKLPTVTSTQTVWYAPSLGVVRRRLDQPSESGIGRDVTDERLTAWDGLP